MYVVEQVAKPAHTHDWTYTVPGQRLLRVFAVHAVLTLDSSDAFDITLTIGDGTHSYPWDHQFYFFPAGGVANQFTYCDANSIAWGTTFDVLNAHFRWFAPVVLPPGYTITATTIGASVGYQWNPVTVFADDLNLGAQGA